MIQHIDSTRSMLYLRRYAFENTKGYLLLFLAVGAFLILWYGLYMNFSNPFLFRERNQAAYYFVTLFLAGCLSAGMLFAEFSSKAKAAYYLLIPASGLEKFLVRLLFSVLLVFVGCSAMFWGVNAVAIGIANYKFDTNWQVINLFAINRYGNPFFDGAISDLFYFYFAAQAIFILCSVYFKKHSVFKAIVVIGLLWVLSIAVFLIITRILPVGVFHDELDTYEVFELSGDNRLVALPTWLGAILSVYFKFMITPLLWMVAFLKFKEKEL